MSTIDRRSPRTLPPLEAGQRLDQPTFHERYEAMPPHVRAELIGGVVYMPSPLSVEHGDDNAPVVAWLTHFERFTPGVRATVNSTTILGEESEPQPDASLRVLPGFGGLTRYEGDYLAGPPELIFEIARTSRKFDLGTKKADYERAGVPEYVVFALDPDQVYWHALRGGRFVSVEPGEDGIFRSEVCPGLWLDPEALFARDWDALFAALDRGLGSPEHADFVARLAANRRP